jgi:uncharacterized membrane protein (DUF106 family)
VQEKKEPEKKKNDAKKTKIVGKNLKRNNPQQQTKTTKDAVMKFCASSTTIMSRQISPVIFLLQVRSLVFFSFLRFFFAFFSFYSFSHMVLIFFFLSFLFRSREDFGDALSWTRLPTSSGQCSKPRESARFVSC